MGVFSESVFSESVFSESVFSEGVFSESVFSESVFSENVFSESIFYESVFSDYFLTILAICGMAKSLSNSFEQIGTLKPICRDGTGSLNHY